MTILVSLWPRHSLTACSPRLGWTLNPAPPPAAPTVIPASPPAQEVPSTSTAMPRRPTAYQYRPPTYVSPAFEKYLKFPEAVRSAPKRKIGDELPNAISGLDWIRYQTKRRSDKEAEEARKKKNREERKQRRQKRQRRRRRKEGKDPGRYQGKTKSTGWFVASPRMISTMKTV